ncbi:MAG: DUF418 domain-containing protein [Dysgonamonadaceae bacterium]|jgi:uncharacterized protein|nr:DUF418 domain-containing protein [Dysgonamonadaceae bacterium]
MNEQNLNNALITAPVQAQERIAILDIIRGIALLGILLVHMPAWFGTPAIYLMILGESMWTNVWDTTFSSFISIFVEGKFYTMFSFLFGLGFVIFFERAKARSISPKLLFFKRLIILLIIGLIHAFFIWYGDILVSYALFGFLLPLFFNCKPKTLIIWVVAFFSVLLLIMGATVALMGVAELVVDEATRAGMAQSMLEMTETMRNGLTNSFYAYGEGSFAAIMAQRSADVLLSYSQIWAGFFMIFPLFLLGVYIAKKGVFQNIESHLPFIKKAWLWGLAIGLPMSIVQYVAGSQMNHLAPNIYSFIFYFGQIFGNTGLSIFYMTSIILLFQRQNWVSKLKPFGYVGRMALSNYLLQSIIGTMIFYNYGLGLYGQIAPAFGLVFVIVIFTIQILISKWWLARYQFGPVEWLWKSLTYGKKFKNSKI